MCDGREKWHWIKQCTAFVGYGILPSGSSGMHGTFWLGIEVSEYGCASIKVRMLSQPGHDGMIGVVDDATRVQRPHFSPI